MERPGPKPGPKPDTPIGKEARRYRRVIVRLVNNGFAEEVSAAKVHALVERAATAEDPDGYVDRGTRNLLHQAMREREAGPKRDARSRMAVEKEIETAVQEALAGAVRRELRELMVRLVEDGAVNEATAGELLAVDVDGEKDVDRVQRGEVAGDSTSRNRRFQQLRRARQAALERCSPLCREYLSSRMRARG